MNDATRIIKSIIADTCFAEEPCSRCQNVVMKEDFATEAGMCNVCLNDSYAEADAMFAEMQKVGRSASFQ